MLFLMLTNGHQLETPSKNVLMAHSMVMDSAFIICMCPRKIQVACLGILAKMV